MLKKIGQIIILTLTASGGYYLYTAVFAGTTITSNNLDEGLVGYWSFEEGAGLTTGDMSGNGNDGTLTNMTEADWVDGKRGGALDFDGVDDEVEITDTDLISGGQDISISVWVKVDAIPSLTEIPIAKTTNASSKDYVIHYSPDGTFNFYYENGAELDITGCVSTAPQLGEWVFLTATFDNTTFECNFYTDGVRTATAIGDIAAPNGSTPLVFGDSQYQDLNFDGQLDEVRLYNRTLSHEEVRSLYNLSSNKFQATQEGRLTDGLVGYWSFDGQYMDLGSSTSEVKDASGQGNHGDWQNHNSTVVEGKMGQAIDFDGVDDRIAILDDDVLDLTTAFSISAFIALDNVGTHYIVKKTEFDVDDGYELSASGNGKLFFRINQNTHANTYRIDSTTSYPTDGSWMHATAVYDGTNMRLYIDGVEETSATGSSSPANARNLILGDQPGGSQHLNGKSDEVRVYNRALSADEVAQLYQMGVGTKINTTQEGKSTTGLVGHWSFDGPYMDWASTTAEVLDSSTNSNNGDATTTMNTRSVREGKVGQALNFDGVGSSVIVPDYAGNSNLTAMTWTAWIYPEGWGANSEGDILRENDNTCSGNELRLANSGGQERLRAWFSPGNDAESADGAIKLDEWQHITVTMDADWDHTANEAYPHLYINGVEVEYTAAQTAGNNNLTDLGNASCEVSIGGEAGWVATNRTFDGHIDEVRVYDTVLTEEEILDMYVRESGVKRLDVGLVGYWPFRAGTSQDVRDFSEYGRHGYAQNMGNANWLQGKVGYALSFDGTTDWVSTAALEIPSQTTINLWYKNAVAPAGSVIDQPLSWNSVNDEGIAFSWDHTSASAQQAWSAYNTGYDFLKYTTSLLADTWYMLTYTYDGIAHQAYLNGALEVATTTAVASDSGSEEIIIGAGGTVGERDDGLIDEVRIYNRALSADEVAALYNQDR